MKQPLFVRGLLSICATVILSSACTDAEPEPPLLATLVASPRSTAELAVSTWEVRGDADVVQVIGRDAAAARQVELVLRREVGDPDERVDIEVAYPELGELQITRDGAVDHAATPYLNHLGANVHVDLGVGATPVAAEPGFGVATAALGLDNQGTIQVGWDLFSRTMRFPAGGACRSGTIRHHGQISADNGAPTAWLGWALPAPDTDCTSLFLAIIPAGTWDTLRWVIFDDHPDLALGRAASQSNTPSWGRNAAVAVDGNTDGNWADNSVTHTDIESQAWWQVDLGVRTNLGEVVVFNRTDCCSDRLSDFDILVSDDGVTWQVAAGLTGPALARTSFTMRTAGRFVRVQLRGANYLSLAEVQVFAP
jgi:hypothetical protein